MGLAWMPDFLAADALADGRLQRVLPAAHAPGQFSLLWPGGRHPSARLRVFIDYAVAHLFQGELRLGGRRINSRSRRPKAAPATVVPGMQNCRAKRAALLQHAIDDLLRAEADHAGRNDRHAGLHRHQRQHRMHALRLHRAG
jgi:hypothetical protein